MALAPSYGNEELFDAQAHVWNHIFNFINSMSLKCAVQLNIPDIIHRHAKPIKLSELVGLLSIDQAKTQSIYRLMRILTHSKFFVKVKISEENEEDGYWLTSASRLLLSDEPSSMKPFLLTMLEPVMTDPWHSLSKWFQSSDHQAIFSMAHGITFWEYAGQEPRFNQGFNEAMASDARLVSRVILKDCKQLFEGVKSLVDVGGGTGTMGKAIASSFSGIRCTVLDLPHVVAGLEGNENLTYVGGNMFEFIPTADVLLLKWVLDCWDDGECVRILKKCKEAIPRKEQGGKLIIIDMVVDEVNRDDKGIETQLLFDVMLMAYITGRERTEKEWEKLFTDAGFTSYKITPALGLRSVIEVFYD